MRPDVPPDAMGDSMDLRLPGGRDLTRIALLAMLGRLGPSSRADIARELSVNPATVTQLTKLLLREGLVEELHQAPSTGGRPGQLLGIVGDAGRALGVKLASDHVVVVDVRLDGTVLASQTEAFDALADDAPDRLAAMLRPYVEKASEVPLLGLGVAVPGVVDSPDSGNVKAQVLGWSNVPLGRHLRGALGLPVLVENDVKSVTIAEQLYGRGRLLKDFLVVSIGYGVGLGVITNGSLYRGSRGGAGEFGHFSVASDGPMCACGNRGCLEALIGAAALVTDARSTRLLRDKQGIGDLERLAEDGNQTARSIFAQAGARLARSLAALITVLDPEKVIVLGEGTSGWQHWDAGFRAVLNEYVAGPVCDTSIEVEPWDDTNWAQGAAALVLATPFDLDGFAGRQAEHVLARLHRKGGELTGIRR
jgi:predicted NBD/HSP70 family sugar kinase